MNLQQFKREISKLSFDTLKDIAVRYQAEFDPYGERYEYADKREIVHDITEHYANCVDCIDNDLVCDLCPTERDWLIKEVKAGN